LFCFPFHFVSNPPLSGHHHYLSVVDPPSPGLYPTGACLHTPHGVRKGGKGVTTHQVRVDPSLPTCHLIQSSHHWPSNAKGAGERSWIGRQNSPYPLKSFIYFHSVHFRINFSNVHPIWFDS
ncbi:hypothetical protein LDENG_00067010, partial [Lucifuga dentata]